MTNEPLPGVSEAIARALHHAFVEIAPILGMSDRFAEWDDPRLSTDPESRRRMENDTRLVTSAIAQLIRQGLIVPGPSLVVRDNTCNGANDGTCPKHPGIRFVPPELVPGNRHDGGSDGATD